MGKIEDKYLDISNADIRVKLLTMENEYEHLKVELKKIIDRMQELDINYSEMKEVLNKRTRGIG